MIPLLGSFEKYLNSGGILKEMTSKSSVQRFANN
jgi:hypothetical protein